MEYGMTVTGSKIEIVNDRLAKLARKIAKLDVDFVPTATFERRVIPATRDFPERVMFDVVFNFENFVLPGGWVFVATIEHGPVGNIVRSYEGAPETPLSYRTDAPTCDHCGITRDRHNTIVVLSTDGEFKRVGTTCARTYLGISADKLIPLMADINSFGDEDEFFGGHRARSFPTVETVLFDSIAMCKYAGFKPASFQEDSTRTMVSMMIEPSKEESKQYGDMWSDARSLVEDKDVSGALAWLKMQDADSGYISNLNAAVGMGEVTPRNMGLVVSLAGVFLRDIEKIESAKVREARGESEYIANVGDKAVEFHNAELVYANIREGYAYNSPDNIFAILRVNGKDAVQVKTSVVSVFGSVLDDLDKGDTISFKATIKAHKAGKHGPVTVLLRPKLL